MTRFALLILVLFSLISGACSRRTDKLDHSNLIPEKEMVSILTDIHISDGLLTLPKIHEMYSSLDTTKAYIQVIEKHGYSKAAWDKTLKYYFIRKPKNLINIYDKVLGILSERESLEEKAVLIEQTRISNLWKGKDLYCYPELSTTDSARFDLNLTVTGSFALEFSATLFPDDQSVNPRFTAYTCNADSVETGKKKYVNAINYIKDGRPHTYRIVISVPEKARLQFIGNLYYFDNHPDDCEKHMIIRTISFTYSSVVL